MKLVKMRVLARRLGIPIRTFQYWVQQDPDLGVFRNDRYGGSWWIKLEKLSGRQGISLIDAYMLGHRRWIKAVDLAKARGINRYTMKSWCRRNPHLVKRIGRVFYIDLEDLGASHEDIEALCVSNSDENGTPIECRGNAVSSPATTT